MAYASGSLIEATDYNNLAWGGTQGTYTASPNNIAYVMGVGNGEFGYGQDVSAINTVTATGTVTAVQWSGLLTTLNKALGHQSGSGAQLTVTPAITAGNVITYFSTVSTAVGTINTNKALYTAQGSTTTGSTNTWNSTAGLGAASSGFVDTNVTFASANAARYFFNAGGQINFVCSAIDSAGTDRSTSIRDLINNMGGITAFRNTTNGGRSGSGGTIATNNTAFGYRNLTATPQTIVQTSDVSPYGSDYTFIQCFTNTADTTNGSTGASIVFRTYYNSAADSGFLDNINITISTRADIVYPETTYLTSSWGTPTITFDNA
jgi:hypothetical protein